MKFVIDNPQAAYNLLFNSFMPLAAGIDRQIAGQNSGLTFPNFSQEIQNCFPLINDSNIKYESITSKNLSVKSDKDQIKEEKSSTEENKYTEDSDEDDDILKSHPFEIIYILNKKTNRKLKRMVCKLNGCNKIFEKKWNFKDHIRMHNGQTPYQCPECNKSFTQKGNLVKHERQHVFKSLKSRKIHKCSVCDKCFTEKYNLKVS